MGADTFVALQPGELAGADVIVPDQGVLADAPLLHYLPQILIGHHTSRMLWCFRLVHIGQSVADHLVQQLIAANTDSSGLLIDIRQHVGVNAHGNDFLFRLSRNKFWHTVTILVLTIIF